MDLALLESLMFFFMELWTGSGGGLKLGSFFMAASLSCPFGTKQESDQDREDTCQDRTYAKSDPALP